MKKLLALLIVGSLLAMITGCPPAPSTEAIKPPPVKPPPDKPPAPVTPKETKTTGKVTKADAGKITVKPDAGDAKDFTITDDKVVTIDDKPGKATDIKADSTVTVTETDGKISKVEVKAPTAVVAPPKEVKTVGKVTKSADGKITVKPETGDAKDFTVDDKVLTIDDKPAKAADIKPDSIATITETDGKIAKIEVKSAAVTPPPPKEVKTSGKVTKSDAGKITVKPDAGDAKDFTITDDKLVTIDDKPAKAADIKPDSTVTVTETDGKITKVEVKSPAPPPPPKEVKTEGKVVKAEKGKLTVKPAAGDAKEFTIPDGAAVTVDGAAGKVEDIKADSTVTVTETDGKVVKIEAKKP